ncbi:hypothetical protein GN958_ATG14599 [Phytophthora infestans]|uniref:Uncharacterized protein n=1 Tax=Phytophthora infestans TaxID=4787 RepID=A0A8S9UB98_PHYIN|nr:hypothetical protein GN958_ATG14599 [Phytophthora infestans]
MYLRREDDSFRYAIPFDAIPERWAKSEDCSGSDDHGSFSTDGVRSVDADVVHHKRALSHNEKYRAILSICQRIAECVADKGKRDFRTWSDHLTELEQSTKRVCEIDTKRPVEATPESNASPASINSADFGVLVEQVLVNDIKKKKVDSIASAKRRLDMEGSIQDEKELKAAKVKGGKRATLVRLNPANRASGRPKQKAKLRKAKKAKEIEETMLFVDNLVSYGDITLESFEEAVKTKELSVAGVGDTTRAIRPMFESASLFDAEALVLKCLDSAKNVIIRQQLLSDKNPTAKELGVSILDVGTFSFLDIERMKLWHEVSRKLLKARKLIKFVKNLSIERGAESKKQRL